MFKSIFIATILTLIVSPSFAQVVKGSAEDRLFQAVWDQNLVKVQKSLTDGANILAKDSHGNTAADVAVDKGFYSIAHYLLGRTKQALQKQKSVVVKALPKTKLARVEPKPKPKVEKIPEESFVVKNDPFAPSAPTQSGFAASSFDTKPTSLEDILKAAPPPAPKLKPKVKPKPTPTPKLKPKPKVKPKPKAKPKPKPKAKLEPKPKPKPELKPEHKAEQIAKESPVVKKDPFAPSAPTQPSFASSAFDTIRTSFGDMLKAALPAKTKPKPAVIEKPITEPIDVGSFTNSPSKYEKKPAVVVATKEVKARTISHKDMNEALGIALGKTPPKSAAKKPKKCIQKGQRFTICIEKSTWSDGVFKHFTDLPISIYKRFYKGNRAVVGYRKGAATYIKTIFAQADYLGVVEYFTKKYGTPDKREDRVVAPLGKPQQTNVVMTWYGYDETVKRETVLQVAQYDVSQHRFSNLTEGSVVYKYYKEPSVFAYVNPIELVRLP